MAPFASMMRGNGYSLWQLNFLFSWDWKEWQVSPPRGQTHRHTDTQIQDAVQDSVVASRKVLGSIPNVLNRPIVSPLDREAHNNPYLLLHGHRRCFELFLLHIKVNSVCVGDSFVRLETYTSDLWSNIPPALLLVLSHEDIGLTWRLPRQTVAQHKQPHTQACSLESKCRAPDG